MKARCTSRTRRKKQTTKIARVPTPIITHCWVEGGWHSSSAGAPSSCRVTSVPSVPSGTASSVTSVVVGVWAWSRTGRAMAAARQKSRTAGRAARYSAPRMGRVSFMAKSLPSVDTFLERLCIPAASLPVVHLAAERRPALRRRPAALDLDPVLLADLVPDLEQPGRAVPAHPHAPARADLVA